MEALPRIYTVNDFEILTNQESILKRLFDKKFDYRKTAILEEKPKLEIGKKDIANEKLNIEKYKENSVLITASTSSNKLFMLSDNYYPGWRAYVDEKETKIYRANYTFRAIVLPKGK